MYQDWAPVQGDITGEEPPLQEIDAADPINSTFGLYEEVLYVAPLGISGSDVEVVSQCLGDVGRLGGVGAKVLNYLCTHFSSDSEQLRENLSHWADWLFNKHHLWEYTWAMMVGNTVTESCGNLNLSAVLETGIEGDLHTTLICYINY